MTDYLWTAAVGWISGAVVNYLADILPVLRKFAKPVCPVCEQPLTWVFYLWPAASAKCGHKGRIRTWIVLLGSSAAAVMLYQFPPQDLGFWVSWLWVTYFALVIVIDMEHRLILHPVSVTGAGLGVVTGIILHGIWRTAAGGAVGFLIMLALYFLGAGFVQLLSRFRGEKIEEVALGFGDVNLAGVIGLLLGWPGILAGIVVAVVLGGVISGIYLALQAVRGRYQAFQALPYGPFLALSALLLLIISDYL